MVTRPMPLRVSLGQFTASMDDIAANVSRLTGLLRAGARAGSDLVCFPELCVPGYTLDPSHYLGRYVQELTRADASIAAAGREYGVQVMYGTARAWNDQWHNVVVLVDPDGESTVYAKTHVPVLERAIFTPGDSVVVTADADLALGCCYDLAFPSFCADLAGTGARALFFPMAWETQRAFVFEGLVRARAIESVAYVICVNQTGSSDGVHFYGRSRIIDPLGRVVTEMGEEEGIATADLELDWVDRLRSSADASTYPLLADRCPPMPVRRGPKAHDVAGERDGKTDEPVR
jgi:omega-amidase